MASVRFIAVQARPPTFLDCTSLARAALQPLRPSCEAAFPAHLATWGRDGPPRPARQCAVYQNGPLPTPEERRLFLLADVQTDALQVGQGRLCGMGQSQAQQWRPVLLPALRTLGAAPARALPALAQRLGGAVTAGASMRPPREEAPTPVGAEAGAMPAAPLMPRTARNGVASAPKTRGNKRQGIAASKAITPSQRSCSSRLSSSSG